MVFTLSKATLRMRRCRRRFQRSWALRRLMWFVRMPCRTSSEIGSLTTWRLCIWTKKCFGSAAHSWEKEARLSWRLFQDLLRRSCTSMRLMDLRKCNASSLMRRGRSLRKSTSTAPTLAERCKSKPNKWNKLLISLMTKTYGRKTQFRPRSYITKFQSSKESWYNKGSTKDTEEVKKVS